MSDGFLARWSRRKRDEARRPAEVAPDPGLPAAEATGDEVALSPEELAQLPSLDAFTAATDLAPFLRAGVPRVLRNAALRRMWSIDPAIRDFVSEAREYAYDWNTPGGVPGTGGTISAEDVRAMVERVFGGGEEKDPPGSDDSDVAGERAAPPSPGGQGEGFTPLAGVEASSEPEVRRKGEEVSTSEPHPAPPPRSGFARAPLAPDKGDSSLCPPTGRGESPPLSLPPDSATPAGGREARRVPEVPSIEGNSRLAADRAEPPTPPRLRRHGGALPI